MKTAKKIYLRDYAPPAFFIESAGLIFDIQKNLTKVNSTLKIKKNPIYNKEAHPLVLDRGGFEIESVIADGMILLPGEYRADDKHFILANTPDEFELEITTILKPHENTSLEGLYKSGNILCTQCEAQGFRKITPFADRPDVLSVYTCTIIADKDKYPVLLSNGNPVKSGDLDNNRHFVTWEDPFKKPCYLFAMVAGDLACLKDTYTTGSGRTVELRIYCEKGNTDKCRHAMKSLKQAMEWDEKRFSLEYDLDLYQIVAISDFNAGAMENKGLNIFNSRYVLADPKSATDEDFLNIQNVIGHEYFHNWTGNRVTVKNWFQLSLKEGLTVFRDQEFSSDLNSRGVKRVSVVKNLRNSQFPEDSGPMAHPVRPESYIKMDNFYTATVYDKGAEIVRMIHQLIGEKNFQKGMSLYFERFDGMAVAIEDFIAVMEEAGNRDLGRFRLWYCQSGTPCVTITRKYDPALQQLEITLEQHTDPDINQSVKKPFHIPVRFGIIGPDGQDISPAETGLLELNSEKHRFTFDNIPGGSVPSFFRRFSAPVKIKTDLTDDELCFLMACDTDEFNRWDCAQTLFMKQIITLVEDFRNKKTMTVSPGLVKAFEKALKDRKTDMAFLARMLCLPDEAEIKEHFDLVDVTAIHESRQFLRHYIAQKLQSVFMDIIGLCSKTDPSSISHESMAARSLKNLSLSYLGSLKHADTTELVMHHYSGAKNMTDEIAAFKILSDIGSELKKEAADRFYKKWSHDRLVMDKWFAVQAGSCLEDTLDEVRALIMHPDFSMKNPNRVRSLIHAFAFGNHVNFHRHDGAGYRFVSKNIIELDNINHQVAARLAGAFNHWKKYDVKRQSMMKKELERILAVKTLSSNVHEIVSRAVS
jgi:aminopeptidase N